MRLSKETKDPGHFETLCEDSEGQDVTPKCHHGAGGGSQCQSEGEQLCDLTEQENEPGRAAEQRGTPS